jgi:uncharacterized protein YwgA
MDILKLTLVFNAILIIVVILLSIYIFLSNQKNSKNLINIKDFFDNIFKNFDIQDFDKFQELFKNFNNDLLKLSKNKEILNDLSDLLKTAEIINTTLSDISRKNPDINSLTDTMKVLNEDKEKVVNNLKKKYNKITQKWE